jgi:hypothetical protein
MHDGASHCHKDHKDSGFVILVAFVAEIPRGLNG